ncbi:MAG: glycosyltransferase [Patescibacteria group bacterium]
MVLTLFRNRSNINFIFLGTYNDRKNQLYLLKVFKNLPNKYQLNLYGKKETGGEYLIKLDNYLKKNIMTNAKLNDFSNDITSVFKNNDFLISASKKEAQSLVVLQSMAAGKPIIGLENETINELINNSNGLKIKHDTKPIVFAKKITKFVETCDYVNLSKNIRRDSKKFGIELVASKIEKFYKSICNSHGKKSRRNIGKYYQEILKRVVIKK